MLVSALLYKDEIERKLREKFYSDEMMLVTGSLCNWIPNINDNVNDGSTYQYAITNQDNAVVGYITFSIDWYSKSASNFGLMSFDKGDKNIGIAIKELMRRIIKDYKLHRIEWRMIEGNPVERHYDYWCKRLGGTKVVLHDIFKDRYGNYHNDCIYEIILNENN